MTNNEFLLQMLQAETTDISNEHLPAETVKEVFEIINEYDWAVFCSQMGDYDHPGERVRAKQVLNEKLSFYVVAGPQIWKLLKEDGEIRNFYNSHFHTMKDEYNAKAEQYLAEKHLQEQGV